MHLSEAEPKATAHLQVTHSMVLSEVGQGGDAWARIAELIDSSLQTDKQKDYLHTRAAEIFETLESSEVVEHTERSDGSRDYVTTIDIPDNFALDQPLSPFLLAALNARPDSQLRP